MKSSLMRQLSLCAMVFALFAFTQNSANAQNWYIPFDFGASATEPAVNAADAPPGYYFADQACIQTVIDADDFCITDDWDTFCQDAYLTCLGCTELTWYIPVMPNTGPAVYNCVAPAGYYAPDQTCVLTVVLADDFCTDNNWDGFCNSTYETCAFGCDAEWHIPIIAGNGPAVLDCAPPAGYYTPANQTCVASTIESDTFCLTGTWDGLCQDSFEGCAFGCDAQWHIPYNTDGSLLPVYDCDAPAEYITPDQTCIEQTLTDDNFCLVSGWDQICQDAYELCFFGCDAEYYIPLAVGSGPAVLACPGTEPFGYWNPDQFCIQDVINNDAYCVETAWDATCQSTFELCAYGCFDAQWYLPGEGTSGPAVLACAGSEPAGYEVAVNQDCAESTIAGDPFCVETNWDAFCQSTYEGCYIGCTYPWACNYNPTASEEDGSCGEPGCTDPAALNYNASAACDNGLCVFEGSSCTGDLNGDGIVGTSDLLEFLAAFGNVCL